jgi:hypothetical protein
MEMGFDRFGRASSRSATSSLAAAFDWHGLHARLAAAHGARRALLADLTTAGTAKGSFAPNSAEALAAHGEVLASVNRTGLADGKSPSGIGQDVAAAHASGNRG